MIDWTQIILALILALPAIIAAWKATKAVQKIEDNTVITQQAARAASVTSASVEEHREAIAVKIEQAVTKSDAKTAESLNGITKMLNGALDSRIKGIVKQEMQPVHEDMDKIRELLDQLVNSKNRTN